VTGSWPGSAADQTVAALYQAHYRSLVRIVALLLGDDAGAEEVVQDAFVSVHRAWPDLRDGDQALGYLRRGVISRARAHSAAASAAHDPAGAGQPASGIRGMLLMAMLGSLPACQREALVLKYYAGWPDPLIAAAMGIGRRAVNAHIQRVCPPSRPSPFGTRVEVPDLRIHGPVSASL
jgi:DNA-directed RNA polymerase specialized sigma24 family protein